MRLNKILLLILALMVFSLSAASLTLDELIASYNFDFYDGTINITSYSNVAKDLNSNGKNDTILFTLDTDASNSTNFTFVVSLIDKNTTISNSTSKFVSSSNNQTNVTLRTSILTGSVFNYSIFIYNTSDSLVFKKEKIPISITNYETLLTIDLITNSAVNTSSYIKVGLTVNSTESLGNVNVSVFMEYTNKSISSTSPYTISSGINNVNIYFDNETIKSTHYNGIYTINRISIGDFIVYTNNQTSSYNYEDFAKTSYFFNYSDSALDLQADNISEFFDLNFTINIKDAGNYTIEYSLFDLFNNFVLNYTNTTNFSSTGVHIFSSRINATEIHYSKVDGPYLIQFANLSKSSKQVDFILEPYITNAYSYLSFAAPPLPDFNISLSVNFTANRTATLNINVTNKGNAPAFNVLADVFDNESYSNTSLIPNINISQVYYYQINATNISSKIVAVVDFDDLIEEQNETNNIDTYGISSQNEPTKPSELFCGTNLCIANNTFFNQVDILCNGSVDPEGDNITYFIDSFYNHSTNVSHFFLDEFSNGLNEENISFSGEENITRYITIPKNVTVNFAQMVLKSQSTYESGVVFLQTPDTQVLEDTFTNDAIIQRSTNYGSSVETFVANQSKSDQNIGQSWTWITFNITGVPDGATIISGIIGGYSFESANFYPRVLKLYYSPNSTWEENNLVYLNKPELGFLVNITNANFPNVNDYGWLLAEAKTAVQAALGNNSNRVSVVWVGAGAHGISSSGSYIRFHSKEYTTNSSRIFYLNISYEINNTIFNPSMDVSGDGTDEWSIEGALDVNNSPQYTSDLSREINNYLFDCTPDQYGNCSIPLVFHSDKRGILTYYDINISYQSNQYYWERIGNHTPNQNLTWNFTNITAQESVMIRCSSSDINGSQLFSDYLQPLMNMTINTNLTSTEPTFNVANLSVLNSSGTNFIFGFSGINLDIFHANNLSWILQTGFGQINSELPFNLTGSERVLIFVEETLVDPGQYMITAIISNSTISDSEIIMIEVPGP